MADPGSPKAVVLEFYKLALERFQPKDAFERYAAPLRWVRSSTAGKATA